MPICRSMRRRVPRYSSLAVFTAGVTGASTFSIAQVPRSSYQAAVTVLKNDVVYTVRADGTHVREETARVRVNSAQAVQSQSQTYLPFSASLQRLEVLEAHTETADGRHIPVAPDQIITQQSPFNANAPAFADVKVTAIVFPQIVPGAVKVYRYRVTQLQPLFESNFSAVEVFPATVEYERLRVTFLAPADRPLHAEVFGLRGGVVEPDEPNTAKWVWELTNATAIPPEPNSVNVVDFSPRIAVTTFATFNEASDAYLKRAAAKTSVTPAVQSRADELTAGIRDPRAQARALYNWVASNVRYVALAFGLGGVVPRNADAILSSGYGDCKDKTTLLSALLAAKGIDSNPVLINNQNAYWQPKVAALPGIYNHAILYVPQLDLYLDPTAAIAPFGVLPPTELGKSALVTGTLEADTGVRVIPSSTSALSTTRMTTRIRITDDGSANGDANIVATGGLEFLNRAAISRVPPGQEDGFANSMLARSGQVGRATLAAGDPRDLDRPLTIDTTFLLPQVMNLPGPGALTIPAGIASPVSIESIAAELGPPSRAQRYVCGAYAKVETTDLTLPEGVKVQTLPRNVAVTNSLGAYRATYTREGPTIQVRRELVLNPLSAVCDSSDYRLLRELGEAVARDKLAQVIY